MVLEQLQENNLFRESMRSIRNEQFMGLKKVHGGLVRSVVSYRQIHLIVPLNNREGAVFETWRGQLLSKAYGFHISCHHVFYCRWSGCPRFIMFLIVWCFFWDHFMCSYFLPAISLRIFPFYAHIFSLLLIEDRACLCPRSSSWEVQEYFVLKEFKHAYAMFLSLKAWNGDLASRRKLRSEH